MTHPILILFYQSLRKLIFLLCVGGIQAALYAAELPPPDVNAHMPDGVLYLELVLNGKRSEEVIPVKYTQGRFYLPRGKLQQLGLKTAGDAQEIIAVDSAVKVSYDSTAQQLQLTAPIDQLPAQYIQKASLPQETAVSDPGILINYDLYMNHPQQKTGRYLSLWSELRTFGQLGILTHTGTYHHPIIEENRVNQATGYMRYDTRWQYSDDKRLLTYQAGDIITGSLPWSGATRLGGVQIARNFALRPDIITYPLPQFAGQAALPSAVELFINSYKTTRTMVNPGPFTVESTPFINGAGNATIVTTDAQGRKISTEVPFYVTSQLLKKGLTDYSVSVGALRQDYGLRSFSYGKPAISSVIRHGVVDFLTLEAQAEGAQGLTVTGAGVGMRLGLFGVLNAAKQYSYAQPHILEDKTRKATGQHTSLGYSYSNAYISFAAQRQLSTPEFLDLGSYPHSFRTQRRSDLFSTSVSLGRFGAIGMGYFATQDVDNTRTRLVNLSYNNTLGKNISLYATLNRAIGTKGYNVQLQVSIPFGRLGAISASASQSAARQKSQQLIYSRAVPSDGGFGWNVGYGRADTPYHQASLAWRNRYFQLQGGHYGNTHNQTTWSEVNGSVILMDKEIYATNQINDAFVLVSTDGYPQVPVYYEHQRIGPTDKSGHLLIPTVSSRYSAQFAIDTLQLPANVRIPKVEQRLVVQERSGALLRFPVKQIHSATLILHDIQGQALPPGSVVSLQGTPYQTYVGWDGLVFIEEVSKENQLTVTLPDQQTCQVRFLADLTAPMPFSPLQCIPFSPEQSRKET